MRKRSMRWLTLGLLILTAAVLLSGCSEQIIVMNPKGPIGEAQKDLIIVTTILCLIILIPVFALTGFIVYRYRDKPGSKAAYRPNWSHNTVMEATWWAIPVIIIGILAVITVQNTHALEPSKPIQSDKKPLVVQVTSLDWKWLFKYPEQGIATVNYLYIPEDVPVKFELTSDAPMNSFWIPQLGGQIYTMSGMAMTLYLQADEPGVYFGSGANFTGEMFAHMRFDVHATSEKEFDAWVDKVKQDAPALTLEGYTALAEPGISDQTEYSSFPKGLFEKVVTKYAPGGHGHHHAPAQSEDDNMQSSASENTEMESTMTHDAHTGH
ncbi:ubiquinol oxidase subunit II [Paenibacillus thermotolerans]|uniref:ubiquinol oxidase subunit II n=1 Tax=Paenibacillus thermotolerans TaxID=3027807 RepID=UPI0023681FAB|nr:MULTISPECIES: ubiquinol oxidase subunit II [unclassified Paenibacillus]